MHELSAAPCPLPGDACVPEQRGVVARLLTGTHTRGLTDFAAPVCLLLAAQDFPYPDTSSETAALAVFPNCVCDTYQCAQGPYRLTYASRTVQSNGIVRLCFSVAAVDCSSQCCNLIKNNLEKLEFEAGEPHVERARNRRCNRSDQPCHRASHVVPSSSLELSMHPMRGHPCMHHQHARMPSSTDSVAVSRTAVQHRCCASRELHAAGLAAWQPGPMANACAAASYHHHAACCMQTRHAPRT